jgi:Reverse transcriptase (RNA-dependent DNA polymerase)
MLTCPNSPNSINLQDMCDEFELVDPYRYLYPDRRDYSFIPKDKNKTNRSRLDYFLVSSGLLNLVKDCDISSNLQNSLFDHKAIFLKISPVIPKGAKSFRVKNLGLNIDILEILVECATAETYLIHADPQSTDQNRINDGLLQIGMLKQNCKEIKYPFEYWPPGSYDGNDVIRRILQLEQLKIRVRQLNTEELLNLPVTVDKLTMYEVLLNNIRNEIISFQAHFFKWKRAAMEGMKTKLVNLKRNYLLNFDAISELETKINTIFDLEAKSELENFSTFEILNSEKMSPAFSATAKGTRSAAKISDIKDDNGNAFDDENDLKNYIVSYYANIYAPKPDTDLNLPGCIEEFLGPEICNRQEVLNSKITQAEQVMLSRNLTVEELDSTLGNMSSKSAGGPDGMGIPVLKKFWKFLRLPLRDYCLEMMRLGKMSPSFLTSAIKLIPKKGDTSKIKNWRPISLLNVSYKIISKAINNRLKKISGRILSRAQKGFTNNRYIQECIMYIMYITSWKRYRSVLKVKLTVFCSQSIRQRHLTR